MTARGTKLMKANDHVTLYVTTNATGTDTVPLTMIDKRQKPRCFKRENNASSTTTPRPRHGLTPKHLQNGGSIS